MNQAPWEACVLPLLQLFDGMDGPSCEQLWWRTDGDYAPITFLLNCNDLFAWACADAEVIRPEDLPALQQAVADCQALTPETWDDAALLWCCRKRQMRPQRPYYQYLPPEHHALFDACGPARDA